MQELARLMEELVIDGVRKQFGALFVQSKLHLTEKECKLRRHKECSHMVEYIKCVCFSYQNVVDYLTNNLG